MHVGNRRVGHPQLAQHLHVIVVLYNGYLSGVSLSGDRFFYQNALESAGRTDRVAYFDVA